MSLIRKTTRGLFWISFSAILIKIINFVITVILARLLDPEHFGLVAMALILVNFFENFRDLGIGAALIYKKKDLDAATNTAFFLLPIAAAVFYLISYFLAPFAADFFKVPQIESLIKVLSLIFLIWSFGSLPSIILDKNLEFKKKLAPMIIPKIGYGIAAILLAINGFGVWSLVIGRLILEILSVIVIWLVIDWRPSYKFNLGIAFELIGYGKQVAGANILFFLISIVDISFIGRFLGPGELGFYSIALGIAGLLTLQISLLLGQVMFPVYALIGDKYTLKKAYVRTIKYISLVSIPATFGIFVIAEDFVKVIYGDKWLPAVGALQILCFYGLNRSLLSTTENLYLAAGKPGVRTKLNLIQLVLMSVLMYPLTMRYGIIGTGIAALLPSILILYFTFKEAGKILDENFIYIGRLLFQPLEGSLIIVLTIELLHYILPLSPIYNLTLSVFSGFIMYIVFIWLAQKEELYELKRLFSA